MERGLRGRVAAAVLLAVVLVAAAACSGGDPASEAAGEPALPSTDLPAVETGGFDGTFMRVGALTAQTGPQAAVGRAITAGNRLYFEHLNGGGGIAGRYPVILVVDNTGGDVQLAREQYLAGRNLVAMYVQVFDDRVVEAILPDLARDRILAGPASTDPRWVTQPYLVPVGVPDDTQVAAGVDHAATHLGARGTGVCALTTADAHGRAALAALQGAAASTGVPVGAAVVAGEGGEPGADVGALAGAGCRTVLLAVDPVRAPELLGAAQGQGFAPTWLVTSASWTAQLGRGELGAYLAGSALVLGQGPQWGDASVPGMAQLAKDLRQDAPGVDPEPYLTLGYAQAWAAAQVLEQAVEGRDLSSWGVVRAAEQVGTLAFDGLLGDYGYGPPAERTPPREATIFAVDPTVPGALRVAAPPGG